MRKYTHFYITEFSLVLIAISFGLFFVGNSESVEKFFLYAIGVAGFVCLVSWFLQIIKSATVFNGSDQAIKAKLVNCSDKLVDVKSGEKLCGIDGVKVNGRVYRVTRSTTIVVNKDGTVVSLSLIDKLLNSGVGSSYMDKCPDDSWKALFNS